MFFLQINRQLTEMETMNDFIEKPFESLRRLADNNRFEDEIVKNWYIARAFVLEKLKDIAFTPDSKGHLHVVLLGDSPILLSVMRHVALSAHYINFNEEGEESKRNRTVITLVSHNADIKNKLEKEEYLCNLPKYCSYTEFDAKTINPDSHIDIAINVVSDYAYADDVGLVYLFKEEDVDDFLANAKEKENIFGIDTRKAVYASRMYNLGYVIDNLPAENIHSANRYVLALDVYQHEKLKAPPTKMFDENKDESQIAVREKLSNVFCSDCFESREKSILLSRKDNCETDRELWAKYNEFLSKSEHARWVVEKLIMGYSPLTREQRYEDESLFYDKEQKKQYRKSLKKDGKHPAHIDLCSYRDLRRVNPDDMKYDSFLMLAIPKILSKVNK